MQSRLHIKFGLNTEQEASACADYYSLCCWLCLCSPLCLSVLKVIWESGSLIAFQRYFEPKYRCRLQIKASLDGRLLIVGSTCSFRQWHSLQALGEISLYERPDGKEKMFSEDLCHKNTLILFLPKVLHLLCEPLFGITNWEVLSLPVRLVHDWYLYWLLRVESKKNP